MLRFDVYFLDILEVILKELMLTIKEIKTQYLGHILKAERYLLLRIITSRKIKIKDLLGGGKIFG